MAVNRRKKKQRQDLARIVRWILMAMVLAFILIFYVLIHKMDKTLDEAEQKLTSLQQQLKFFEQKNQKEDGGTPLNPEREQNTETVQQNKEEQKTELELSGTVQEETKNLNEVAQESEQVQNSSVQEASEQEVIHKVYLTFDDGPSENTVEILEILDRYDVKATFFVIGQEAEKNPELVQEIVNRGHTLGMHSYKHDYETLYQSKKTFAADLMKVQNCLYGITGVMSNIYRFPGGSSNVISTTDMQVFVDYLKEQQIYFFDWNISSGDGGSAIIDADVIVKNCTENQGITERGTSIILLHDSIRKDTTVEALPRVIETILDMENTEILPITEDTTEVHHK